MFFYDTETCGFYGLPVLIQYAKDEGPVQIHDVWSEEVGKTLDLIEEMMEEGVCGYHLGFDHFQLCKIYTTLMQLSRAKKPENMVHDVYLAEEDGRFGPCVKPKTAVDLFLHVKKSKFQQAMGKRRFKISKVHRTLAWEVCDYLNNNLHFDRYLHVSKDPIWSVVPIKNKKQEVILPEFRDIVASFKMSTKLKDICIEVFGLPVTYFNEVMPDTQPVELGYIPWAKGIVDLKEWPTKTPPAALCKEYCGTWPLHIQIHKMHWKKSQPRQYAIDDVEWTRKLYHYFEDPVSDYDSELACSVAACRWRGFDLDLDRIEELREEALSKVDNRIASSTKAREYIVKAMDEFDLDKFERDLGNTDKNSLAVLSTWKGYCDKCEEGCAECPPSEVAIRAMEVIESRKWKSKALTYGKLKLGGRFHPSFSVIGTKSSRMSGSDGFNPQGIDRSHEMRSCFTLGESLMGGDFSGFELTIADAVYKDPTWHEMLLTDKKHHAVFGAELYGKTYEEIMDRSNGLYDSSKAGFFQLIYGGTADGMSYKLGIPVTQTQKAENKFFKDYPKILERRAQLYKKFKPLSKGVWHTPDTEISSLLGHKRYFELEFKICKFMYDLSNNIPFESDTFCERTKGRRQLATNALQSALHGFIHGVQKKAARAAINHEIQPVGGCATKIVQSKIWKLQPHGIKDWVVQPMNIHDEIPCVVYGGNEELVRETVYQAIDELKEVIPLLKMDWASGPNWDEIH